MDWHMYINPALVRDLNTLTAPTGTGAHELALVVQSMEDAATLAIRSLLGWKLTLGQFGQDVTLTALQPWVEPEDIRASLLLPVESATGRAFEGTMTLYAGRAGAFLLLVHDLASPVDLASGAVRLDHDLTPDVHSGIRGLAEWSTINQAIGVLVGRGDTPPGAQRRLRQDAATAGYSVHTAALRLLSEFKT
jgi:hypothetical protein